MKVGIYINTVLPEAGGGYTFESQLLNAIITHQKQNGSGHKFVLLVNSGMQDIDVGNIKVVDLREKRRFCLANKIRFYILFLCRKAASRKTLEKSRIENILRTEGIEFLIYIKQRDLLTLDVPYMTIVWDLQHRLQPYFPEVSNHHIWKQREERQKILLQRAAYILTGTNAGRKQIERFYQVPTERIIVNPMPVPGLIKDFTDEEISQVLAKYRLGKNYLLYPAQFWPHKNHATLLKAVELLKSRYNLLIDVILTGADHGNKNHIQYIAQKLGITEQIRMPGFIDRKELSILYKKAFALIYVTFFGPDNLPPLEAFAFGCPVIASNVDGAEEQLGNAALFVNPHQVDEITESIYKLYQNPSLRNELIKKGCEQINSLSQCNYLQKIISALNEFEIIRNCWSSSEAYIVK